MRKKIVKSEIVAIILSDVHLGAIGTSKSQFNSFLKRLIRYPKLHLILAGDFIDLMCESIPELDSGAQKIFHSLQTLQEKGTEIIFTLGNHEIPAVAPYETGPASLTGDAFRERADKFKLKLSTTSHLKVILPKLRVGQYALLEKSGKNWEVHTYDSLLQVQLNPASVCHSLVAHGFQFERTTPERSETWKNAVESPNSLKDIMDFFFNGAARPMKDVLIPDRWKEDPEAVPRFNPIKTSKNIPPNPSL